MGMVNIIKVFVFGCLFLPELFRTLLALLADSNQLAFNNLDQVVLRSCSKQEVYKHLIMSVDYLPFLQLAGILFRENYYHIDIIILWLDDLEEVQCKVIFPHWVEVVVCNLIFQMGVCMRVNHYYNRYQMVSSNLGCKNLVISNQICFHLAYTKAIRQMVVMASDHERLAFNFNFIVIHSHNYSSDRHQYFHFSPINQYHFYLSIYQINLNHQDYYSDIGDY